MKLSTIMWWRFRRFAFLFVLAVFPFLIRRRLRLYVGNALTHASQEYKDQVNRFKAMLEKNPWIEVLHYLGTGNPDDGSVFAWDILDCVCKADFFVPILDHPSLGTGYEACQAVAVMCIPVLGLAHKDAKVSQLIRDLRFHFPDHCQMLQYRDLETDGYEKVISFIQSKWYLRRLARLPRAA